MLLGWQANSSKESGGGGDTNRAKRGTTDSQTRVKFLFTEQYKSTDTYRKQQHNNNNNNKPEERWLTVGLCLSHEVLRDLIYNKQTTEFSRKLRRLPAVCWFHPVSAAPSGQKWNQAERPHKESLTPSWCRDQVISDIVFMKTFLCDVWCKISWSFCWRLHSPHKDPVRIPALHIDHHTGCVMNMLNYWKCECLIYFSPQWLKTNKTPVFLHSAHRYQQLQHW